MNLTDYVDSSNASTTDSEVVGPRGTLDSDEFHEDEHEQNDNWEWSDAFTEYINDLVSGRSLKVCPGLRPICDVNLDLKDLSDVADSENAAFSVEPVTGDEERLQALRDAIHSPDGEDIIYGRITPDEPCDAALYDGYAAHGDMFDLPFDDNTFDTTVADPPWLNLTQEERRAMFTELVRVTKPTGAILYNATWIPENEHARRFDLRFRQQLDFWGGPSFAAFYRRAARDFPELFDAHDYESVERYPEESPWWSEPYSPEALSTTHNTDPKLVTGTSEYQAYCCPMCGCSELDQLRSDEFFETDDGQYTMYQCRGCDFRVDKDEVHRLAKELLNAAERNAVPVTDVKHIEYTPKSIETGLERDFNRNRNAGILSPDLPWVPNDT